MRQGRSVAEHRAEQAHGGVALYQAGHPWPVLLGRRVLGEPTKLRRVDRRPTLLMDLASTDLGLAGNLADRVWFICRADDGPRLHGISAGRAMDNDVVVPDYSISMRHCEFLDDADGVRVVDRGALNGTRVGDVPLQANQPLLLKDGQAITLGRFEFLFLSNTAFMHRLRSTGG